MLARNPRRSPRWRGERSQPLEISSSEFANDIRWRPTNSDIGPDGAFFVREGLDVFRTVAENLGLTRVISAAVFD